MRGIKILAVKGRVFAHDDGVKVFEPCLALGCDFIPSTGIASQSQVLDLRFHALTFLPLNVRYFASRDLVAPLLRLAHHGKTGVLFDLEGGKGVNDEKNVHALNVAQRRKQSKSAGLSPCFGFANHEIYMFLRYWPPTSNKALVIWPNEQTRTASISTSNTLWL